MNLVSYYKPVVICFDEIDVKNNSTDDGLPTELVIADLVKRLHDTLENSELGKGVVIITVMLPDTWRDKLKDMPGGTPDRVSKYTRRNPIDLKHINGDSLVDLVTLWLKQFYAAINLTPPNQLYPFEESKLREFGEGRPTVREALKWCAENFKVDEEILPKDPFERFELVLQRQREENIGDYLEDNSLIVNALRFGLETLKGQILEIETDAGETLNEVTVEDVTEIEPKSKKADHEVEKYIAQVEKEVRLRSHLVQLVKKYLEDTGFNTGMFHSLHGYAASSLPEKLQPQEMSEILIELSSPLTGYLGRIKGSDWESDRFYFLRDL